MSRKRRQFGDGSYDDNSDGENFDQASKRKREYVQRRSLPAIQVNGEEVEDSEVAKTLIEKAFGVAQNQESDPDEAMESIIHLLYTEGNEILTAEFEKFVRAHNNDPQIVDRKVFEDHGETLLHYAAQDGKHRMVQLLFDNGASVMAKTGNGLIAFDLAVCGGHFPVVEYLFGHLHYKDIETLKKSADNFAKQIPLLEEDECTDVDRLYSFYAKEFSRLYYETLRTLTSEDQAFDSLPAIPVRPQEDQEDDLVQAFGRTAFDELDSMLPAASADFARPAQQAFRRTTADELDLMFPAASEEVDKPLRDPAPGNKAQPLFQQVLQQGSRPVKK